MINSVIHIVDDAAWGGVNRLLENLEQVPSGLSRDMHTIIRVSRGLTKAPPVKADVIVSHMAVCWSNLAFFSSLRAANPETPMVHIEHSYSERFSALNVTKRKRFEDLLHMTYALFDRVVAVSEQQGAWLVRRQYIVADQLVVIPSCTKLQHCFDVQAVKPTGPVTIAAIGRLHKQKGFDILVEAFAKLQNPNMQLLVVGDGPEMEHLMQMAKGHSNIFFTGVTNDIGKALAKADAVAMPSRWEPYGLVALEAMAAGRPVICSKIDGLMDHIKEGAIAVPENTVLGWVSMLEKLGTRAAVEALPVGTAAHAAEWNFIRSWNSLVRDVLKADEEKQMAA